jgi:lysozyme family protein
MTSIEKLADEIVAREGGYVNDPDDPGGPTKYGVTLGTMRRLGIDLDRDGRVTERDVKRLDQVKAREIFLDHYFRRPRICDLPECLHPSVFDMYVNAGANAVRILQQLFREMEFDVTVDGLIGPQTAGTAKKAEEKAKEYLSDAYGIARRNYYYALADERPASRKYVCRRDGGKGGWIARAEEFISPSYRLTDEEHRARIARWG